MLWIFGYLQECKILRAQRRRRAQRLFSLNSRRLGVSAVYECGGLKKTAFTFVNPRLISEYVLTRLPPRCLLVQETTKHEIGRVVAGVALLWARLPGIAGAIQCE